MVLCSPLPDDPEKREDGWSTPPSHSRDLWEAIAGRLRETLTETTYDTWFGHARAAVLGERPARGRGPERLHARLDRGSFPRFRRPGAARESPGRERARDLRGRRAAAPPPAAPHGHGRPSAPSREEPSRPTARRPKPSSTRSTRSTSSSSARRTASRTLRRSRLPRLRRRRTTRSSSTAAQGSARRICSRRSATTSASTRVASRCATSRARRS